ncbi:MAG: hypothetical protein PCFJNLEI_03455 [Verrucomicrobiae bacterium]|nr:hypothetical protein [Verrucomicrobiae bacterium]
MRMTTKPGLTKDQTYWLKVAANLRVDRAHGIAPHKPLLLLAVVDLIEEAQLRQPILPLTGELTFRFLAYWTVIAQRRPQRPDIRLPFYHLKSDGFWTPLDEAGQPTTERRRAVAVRLDPDFFACLQYEVFRPHFRMTLINCYFDERTERFALRNLVGLPEGKLDDVVKEDRQQYAVARQQGREARFRLTVVPAYNYTCALTGYRCVTVESGSIVDAAHIQPFAYSRNNHPQNGMALSKNAHWMFDAGLWSLDEDYRVLVATNRFDEAGDAAFLLKRMEGRQVQLPGKRDYWPDKTHMAWHREKRFNDSLNDQPHRRIGRIATARAGRLI